MALYTLGIDVGVVAATAFPAWRDVPLGELVATRLSRDATAVLINDADACGLAEAAHGGLIEAGHMIVEHAGDSAPCCACGQRGCLEAYASGTAVARRARELVAASNRSEARELVAASGLSESVTVVGCVTVVECVTIVECVMAFARRAWALVAACVGALDARWLRGQEHETAEHVFPWAPSTRIGYLVESTRPQSMFSRLQRQETVWLRLSSMRQAADRLGVACLNMSRMLDPEAILFTGGMAAAPGLLDKVKTAYLARSWTALPSDMHIGPSLIAHGHAGVTGAAVAAQTL
ncbi:hypothetical protein JKP88DRAFT_273443 [Tribonema minus]|uniref:ROK family protein n=1 Tax=Tribonema minus TaxID=303371 RepID=A0A835YWH4_9STRA|nr:hypothetical protein JKP88DRAFT_273443 [Tribonema minus]